MRALVVGGGIGGLTAGIALRRAGIEVELFERAPAIGEVGAGISLWPNAIRALDAIGVGAAVRELGCSQGDGAIRTWRGRTMLALSMAEIERASGAPVVMLHRAALIEALRQGFGDRGLNLGCELVDFEQDGRGVRARFANGQRAEGDLLIGADGWRSAVRTRILPAARNVYAGYTGLRGLVDAPALRGTIGETWGRGARFGQIPLVDGRIYWFASWNAPPDQPLTPEQRKERALSIFRGWHAPIEDLIRATDPVTILHDDVRELETLPTWVEGRVALLGDAAHAMTPNLGQGGCMAIEDALVLSRCLKDVQPVETALERYWRSRRERVEAVVRDSRRFGFFGQLQNPLLCALRDGITIATQGRWGKAVVLDYARGWSP